MLTTVHPPFDTRIFHKESISLSKAGHSVTIIAPSNSANEENVDGVNIVTVKKPSSKILHPITMLYVFVAGLRGDFDVYHCHEPGSLLVCVLLKLVKRNKLIYDVHEHSASLIAENSIFPKFSRKIIFMTCNVSEKWLSHFSDYIITVDNVLKEKFESMSNNICVINNYPSLKLFNEYKESSDGFEKTAIYVGGLTKIRGTLETVIAFKSVLKKFPDAKLLFVGFFLHKEYEQMVLDYCHEHNLEDNVIFIGHVPHNKVASYVTETLVTIALLQPNPRYELAIPVKLFEYMASGKPVIISNFKYTSDLLSEVNCGISVDPTNIEEITDSIVWFFENPDEAKKMGKNGRIAAEEIYNWENMEKRLFRIYEGLA